MNNYIDLSALTKKDIVYLINNLETILIDYKMFMDDVFPEFLSSTYLSNVEKSLDNLELILEKMKIFKKTID